MPFIKADEIPAVLGTMVLSQATPNVELAELLQRCISLLQCRDYDPHFDTFYKAAIGYLNTVMSHTTYCNNLPLTA